jgi:hypothetical protein
LRWTIPEGGSLFPDGGILVGWRRWGAYLRRGLGLPGLRIGPVIEQQGHLWLRIFGFDELEEALSGTLRLLCPCA